MSVASSTSEGSPRRCRFCGTEVYLVPSTFPTRDAPCPSCGQLLWYADMSRDYRNYDATANARRLRRASVHRELTFQKRKQSNYKSYTIVERLGWALVALLSARLMANYAGWTATTISWLLGVLYYGQIALPKLYKLLHAKFHHRHQICFAVITILTLIFGPLAWYLFEAIVQYVSNLNLSPLFDWMFTLMIGPLIAGIQHVILEIVIEAVNVLLDTSFIRRITRKWK